MPERIRLRRTTGWRKPEGAIVVARPTRWGNPYIVSEQQTREQAVDNFRQALVEGRLQNSVEDVREQLVGQNLACWCPLEQPCHADVLLEIANQEQP